VRRKPIAIDLFCGAGGLTRGLVDAGFRVVGAAEWDGLAAESYRANFPRVRLWERDIRQIPARDVLRRLRLRRGELDLLAACPPCEGFSTMRTLNGHRDPNDPRNDLVLELQRFVRRLYPKTVLIENVPGLASDHRLHTFIEHLQTLGFEARCDVIDAAAYGVPQRRRRMLLIASRVGPAPALPPKQATATVRDYIAGLPKPGGSGDPLHDHGEARSPEVMAFIRRIPRDGGSRLDLPASEQLRCHQVCDGFKDVYGRMAWDTVAPTITSGCVNPSKGRFLHPSQNRAITLREAALLQTFPPDHYFSMKRGKYATAELIGNALPPRLIRLQAEAVRDHLARFADRRSRKGRGRSVPETISA
jgi:DNA (cytosine-5)-methyltransferase 1